MDFINACDEKILYLGNWDAEGTAKVSRTSFCKAILMFKGSQITVEAEGEYLCAFDGGADCAQNRFEAEDGVHTLYITASAGVRLAGFCGGEVLDADLYLRGKMNEELQQILCGREPSDPKNWKRVHCPAVFPVGKVTLHGMFGTLFDRNVARIKGCFASPHYLLPNPAAKRLDTDWVDWLPAASDARVLGGAAKAYCHTGDSALREIVDAVVEKSAAKMEENGYFGYYPYSESFDADFIPNEENTTKQIMDSERKNYDRTNWTIAMVAAGRAGNQKALTLARRMYDWLENSPYCSHLLLGHNATNAFMGSLSLALSEAGNAEDLLFNQKYLDQRYWEAALQKEIPIALSNYPGDRPHCYALLEILALLYEYQMTGDRHYLESAKGGWNLYRRYYKHPGGATAICEDDGPYLPGSYYMETGHTGESCGSNFWIWINEKLSELFPDNAAYAAEIEEQLFNIVPSLLTEGDCIRYHNRMQGQKDKGESIGTCCEVTSTWVYSDMPKYVYSCCGEGVWINQWIPSTLCTDQLHLQLQLEMQDRLEMKIRIKKDTPGEAFIKIRIPDWAKDVAFFLNDTPLHPELSNGFAVLRACWKANDTIRLTCLPETRLVRYTGAEQPVSGQARYAVFCGPFLMALTGDFTETVPQVKISAEEICRKRTGNVFEIAVDEKTKFVPYFKIGNHEKFCCFPIMTEVQ